MALNRVDFPNANPVDLTDWAKLIDLIEALSLKINVPIDYDFSGDTIKKGTIIMIGGTIYLADSDTAITGTPSDFVKITPAGAIAAAAYVANLSGVTWNDTYNFHEDASNNAYIFDETKATASGTITDPKTIMGKFSFNGWMRRRLLPSINKLHGAFSYGAVYTALSPFLTEIGGDPIQMTGALVFDPTAPTEMLVVSHAQRTSGTQITIFGITYSPSTAQDFTLVVGSGVGTVTDFSISW